MRYDRAGAEIQSRDAADCAGNRRAMALSEVPRALPGPVPALPGVSGGRRSDRGPWRALRALAVDTRWMSLLLFFVTLIGYGFTYHGRPSVYTQYLLLADAFLDGRLHLVNPAP